MDNEVAKQVVLDGVVTLVDALHVQPHLDDPALAEHDNQAVQQIVVADRILLNKTDLVAPEQLADLEDRIRALNSNAPILHTVQARVDLTQILGLQAFECDALASTDPQFFNSPGHVCDENCHDEHNGSGQHSHDVAAMLAPHSHDPSVGSVSLLFDEPFDTERLMRSLNALLAVDGDDIYRVKGILHAWGDERRHVLQGVHRLLELKPSIPWWDEKPGSKLVFIGRRLNKAALLERLTACTVSASVLQEVPEAA
jgi:G3E family GTPase